MGAIASQITSFTIVYSKVYYRKHESSASLAFVHGIHRGPVNSPHKWPVTRKMFPFDDVIMTDRSPNNVGKHALYPWECIPPISGYCCIGTVWSVGRIPTALDAATRQNSTSVWLRIRGVVICSNLGSTEFDLFQLYAKINWRTIEECIIINTISLDLWLKSFSQCYDGRR